MTTTTPAAAVTPRRTPGQAVTLFMGKYGALIVLAALVIVFSVLAPKYFLTWGNIVQIFNQSALAAIIACGLTLVLASNQFDLSIGYTASLAGITVAALLIAGVPISVGTWLGIPRNVYYMVIVVVLLWVLLNRTVLGRNIQAVGGNAEATRLVGVNVRAVTSAAFIICSVLASITGILLASVVGSGQATGGDGYTLQAFAAAFLGTAVMREGQFHILGTLVGVVTVATGFNGLAIIGVPSFVQFLFQGLLLIAAVSFSTVARKLTRTT